MFVESCWFHLLSRTQIDWWTKKCNTQAMYGTLVPFGEHSFMWLPQKCCKPSKDLFWWMYPCYFHGSPSCSQPSDVRLGVRLGTIHWFFSGHRPRCPHYFFVVHLVWYVWYLLWPLRNLNKLLCEPPHQLAHSETLISMFYYSEFFFKWWFCQIHPVPSILIQLLWSARYLWHRLPRPGHRDRRHCRLEEGHFFSCQDWKKKRVAWYW